MSLSRLRTSQIVFHRLTAALIGAVLLTVVYSWAAALPALADPPPPGPPKLPPGNLFIHYTTIYNTSGIATYLDNPITNGNPNAFVIVTPNADPGGVALLPGGSLPRLILNPHPVGVWYNSDLQQWAIVNEDFADMPIGVAFNVYAVWGANPRGTIHTATPDNSVGASTEINQPLSSNDSVARLFVTPNVNPGGGANSVYDKHPIGVWYDGNHWHIFHEDLTPVPNGASFNVWVPDGGFWHYATSGNTTGDHTLIGDIEFQSWYTDVNAIAFVTSNWNPKGDLNGISNNAVVSLYSDPYTHHWMIFNENGAPLPLGAAFNVIGWPAYVL